MGFCMIDEAVFLPAKTDAITHRAGAKTAGKKKPIKNKIVFCLTFVNLYDTLITPFDMIGPRIICYNLFESSYKEERT
jgi:cytochrome c oxidase assembly factor CtaG